MRLHNRQVKAAFWEDPDLLRLPRDARTLFHGLWHLADDSGCLEHDVFAFKLYLFRSPLDADITTDRLAEWTGILLEAGMLLPYEAGGKRCLYIFNFHKHQPIKNPAPPDVPLPMWIRWAPFASNERAGKYIVRNPSELCKPTSDDPVLQSSSNQNLNLYEEEEEEDAGAREDKSDESPTEHKPDHTIVWRKWYETKFARWPREDHAATMDRCVAGGMDSEVVIQTLKAGLERRVRDPLSWAAGVVGNMFAAGVRTLADAAEHERQTSQAHAGRAPPGRQAPKEVQIPDNFPGGSDPT